MQTMQKLNNFHLKSGLAKMLKGGVIMDVTNAQQAVIAEKAGAVAVMALERVPADIRAQGGVARMSHPSMRHFTIPVMAKCRIGHTAEAQILQELKVDFIDESEVLTPADEERHIEKKSFTIPFVCGARNLGEALRRIQEGAAMIRTKGEAGTGNVVEAVRHMRAMVNGIERLAVSGKRLARRFARGERVSLALIEEMVKLGRLPIVNFAAGGIATPADAALMMQLGCDGVFVGSGIFKSTNPEKQARAIVEAVMHFKDAKGLLRAAEMAGEPMQGLEIRGLEIAMQERGR